MNHIKENEDQLDAEQQKRVLLEAKIKEMQDKTQ